MLAWTIYLSFAAAAAMFLIKPDNRQGARMLALGAALAGLAVGLIGSAGRGGGFAVATRLPWIPTLGAQFLLASDGISRVLVLLTGLAAVAGILFSWNVEHRTREFFALYLALIGGVYGVFLSFDLLLLFVFYEIAIVPKYFLIAIWGSARREYAAMKLALYSFAGSAMVLAGLIAAHVESGSHGFDLAELARYPFPASFQHWAFPLVFVGFAILAGLWPFHTWAPTGHAAAPTAASMLLAGVVMKLGAYGCLRVAMTLFPEGLAAWRHFFGALAVAGIVHGALVALSQRDFKFVVGYSSVSHMGFVLLGLMTVSTIGLGGAVLQMFSHGIIAGLLFGVVGRMVYDREHTRDLDELRTRRLGRRMPFAAVTFVVAALASMGIPGFSGFVAEFKVLVGAWQTFPKLALLAGVGIVLGAAYTLRAVQKVFFDGDPEGSPDGTAGADGTTPSVVSLPEKIGASLLVAATVAVGLCPKLLLDWITPSFASPLFDGLRKGGGL
ncbi:MAG: NADH-quinone oxidoreductase subunit M [Verrucomicrobia bacterium]|nr:MAG: NADH-quinone oxidoreductase subunit M [Verrucomicrobiota bacterium]